MSNRAHRRRRTTRQKTIDNLGLIAARVAGCRCEPDIERRHGAITMKHDRDCPAVDAPSGIIVVPPRPR